MKEHYTNLATVITDKHGKDTFDSYGQFVGMRGFNYNNQKDFRPMFIGRATNGWKSEATGLDAEGFGIRMEEIFTDKDNRGFDWLVADSINPTRFSNGTGYYLARSKFWNYNEEVYKELYDYELGHPVDLSSVNGRWFENIFWTNLYKISPQGKNPSVRLARLQLDACKKILKEEIEAAKPTVIIMIADTNWFEPFSDLFSDIHNINNRIVKQIVYFNDIPVLVTVRPEIKTKIEYVGNIMDVYSRLK